MPAEKNLPVVETVETIGPDYQTVKDILNDIHDENVEIFRQLDPPVTPEEHKKLLRKIDLRLPPFLFFLYIFCWLDRANLGNIFLMNFKQDIGLNSGAASFAVAIIYIGTFCGDMFTNLGMRYFRPSIWVAGAMVVWASITLLMAAVTNPAGIYAARLFLGIFEAAFTSGAPYIFTFWFTRKEWGRRIALYFAATPTAGAFGGWIAYGVQHISSPHIKTWQILLILEGSLTMVMAFVALYMLPDRPHNTKWLTPREREVAEWRMLQDGNKTHGHFGFRDILAGLKDWRLMTGIVVFMTQNLSMYTLTTFTPTIVNSFGYTTVRSQLMTAPPYCVGIVLVFIVATISDKLQRRASIFVINTVVVLVGYLMLCLIDVENTSARYGALFLIIPGIVSGVVLSVGNITDNCCGDLKKAMAAGLLQAMGSFMGIASGYMLPSNEAPAFKTGFWTLFGVTLFGGCVALFQAIYYTQVNARRDKEFGKVPEGEIIDFSVHGLILAALVLVNIWRRILAGQEVEAAAAEEQIQAQEVHQQDQIPENLRQERYTALSSALSSSRPRLRTSATLSSTDYTSQLDRLLTVVDRGQGRNRETLRELFASEDQQERETNLNELFPELGLSQSQRSPNFISNQSLQSLLDLITTSSSSATSLEHADLTTLFETFISSIEWNQPDSILISRATNFLFRPLAQILVERGIYISSIRVGAVTFVHDRDSLFGVPYDQLTSEQKQSQIISELTRLFLLRIVERRTIRVTERSSARGELTAEPQTHTDSGEGVENYTSELGLRAFFAELEARAAARAQIRAQAQAQARAQRQLSLSLPLPVASSIIGPGPRQSPLRFVRQQLTVTSRNDNNSPSSSSPSPPPSSPRSYSTTSAMEIPNIITPNPRKKYSKEQWEGRLAETAISKSDLNYMILNYLVVEGYQSAAMKFAQEAGLLSANQNIINGSIKDRMVIKSLIHSGKIQDAIEKINDTDPELLDTNTSLHFALLRLQLIELIRHSYKSKDGENFQPALDFAASHLAQRAPSNPEFLQDLERTMALLCFPPENLIPQLKELMDIKLRIKIAEDVNNVLLERQGMGGDSKIKSLVKLWGWATETLDNRKVDIPPLTKADLF